MEKNINNSSIKKECLDIGDSEYFTDSKGAEDHTAIKSEDPESEAEPIDINNSIRISKTERNCVPLIILENTDLEDVKDEQILNERQEADSTELADPLDLADERKIRKRGRCSGDSPMRLQAARWAHFPRFIPPNPVKQNPSRRCRVCSVKKEKSETRWECEKCLVALHVPKCFKIYHTQRNFQ